MIKIDNEAISGLLTHHLDIVIIQFWKYKILDLIYSICSFKWCFGFISDTTSFWCHFPLFGLRMGKIKFGASVCWIAMSRFYYMQVIPDLETCQVSNVNLQVVWTCATLPLINQISKSMTRHRAAPGSLFNPKSSLMAMLDYFVGSGL